MTIPSAYVDIVEKLATRTDEGKVVWQPASGDEVFIPFDDFAFVLAAGSGDPDESEPWVAIRLRDARGKMVDNFWLHENELGYDDILRLYQAARRQALGIDVALEKIRDALASDQTIGIEPPTSLPGENTPF